MNGQPVTVVACGREASDDGPHGTLAVLARELGTTVTGASACARRCGVVAWAQLGALSLTGPADGPPVLPSGPWAGRVHRMIDALADTTERLGTRVDVDAGALLASRAQEAGWTRRGDISLNGSARLILAADGWVAVNLARPDDREVLPAVLGTPVVSGTEWAALTAWTRHRPAVGVVEALQEVGVPASAVGGHADAAALRVVQLGDSRAALPAAPVVVDLSAMWAGPLAAHLLHRAGARVITVEDPRRPDGARGGPPIFYAELHDGHELRAVDLGSATGRADLAALVETADMVIEASRPRALRGLGLRVEQFLGARAGRTWISITGYGREAHDGLRVAFGDDVAAAGGLVGHDVDGSPVFTGDAIADPLTGLWAATAAAASWAAGGGHLLDVAMAGVAAEVAAPTTSPRYAHRLRSDRAGHWLVSHEDETPVRC